MTYLERARELREELVENRRHLHQNAEVGLYLPKTKAFVLEKLEEYGIKGEACGEGIVALIGKPGRTILLRADMDALPMAEESGLDFACPTGTEAHTCGHDCHTAMLLTAAKMLKEREETLQGTVKLMFQPAEETFEGARNMIEHGVLENPRPDAALAYHVWPGKLPIGLFAYNDKAAMMASVDGFRITIHGKGSHGALPHQAIDPISIGAHIHLALQSLIARECPPSHTGVLTIGQFTAGSAANIIPETAVLQGTIRSNKPQTRALLVRRMKEIVRMTAETFGGTAEIEMISDVPAMISDGDLTRELVGYMQELPVVGQRSVNGVSGSGSEDFALISEEIPSVFMNLSAGYLDERGAVANHNPKVLFNEDVLPNGAAYLAHCASRWLENQA